MTFELIEIPFFEGRIGVKLIVIVSLVNNAFELSGIQNT
jgi:hypothetical protein